MADRCGDVRTSAASGSPSDLSRTFAIWPVALHFAWGDIRARYRRSILGPVWLVLGTVIGVVGLGSLWSSIFQLPFEDYVPSLAIGLVTWQFIAGTISESSLMLMRNAAIVRNLRTPVSFFSLQVLMRNIIMLAHNAVVVMGVLLVFPPDWSWGQWLFLPGLVLVAANLWWISLLLGMLGARFRDLDPLVTATMPLLFFLSPVVFRADHLPVGAAVLWVNPLAYFIAVVRGPLQGQIPPGFVYAVVIALLVGGWTLTSWLLRYRGDRVAFWV
jgi:ABC-type polysaccharide/polyol phosphate export permease